MKRFIILFIVLSIFNAKLFAQNHDLLWSYGSVTGDVNAIGFDYMFRNDFSYIGGGIGFAFQENVLLDEGVFGDDYFQFNLSFEGGGKFNNFIFGGGISLGFGFITANFPYNYYLYNNYNYNRIYDGDDVADIFSVSPLIRIGYEIKTDFVTIIPLLALRYSLINIPFTDNASMVLFNTTGVEVSENSFWLSPSIRIYINNRFIITTSLGFLLTGTTEISARGYSEKINIKHSDLDDKINLTIGLGYSF